MKKFNSKFQKGFSLIEIIVVVFIASIILSIVIISGRSFDDSINLENTAKSIDMKIKLAKSRSISALNGTNHSVHFEADKVVVFEGDTFDAFAPANEVYVFSDNIKINIPVGLIGGGNDLVFNRLIGSTNTSGNISIEVINDPSKTKQIVINSDGQTSLNSFQTSIEPLITNARHVHFHLGWNVKDATVLSLKWVDEFEVALATNDIDIASYLSAGESVFDWVGETAVSGFDQEIRIQSWLDASDHSVLCIIREQTENDKLYIFTDAGAKDIATYEEIAGEVVVELGFDGGVMEIQ
ncbi:MAG: prepilin-type N-terminal cleavage/methylation domain-containing protein [Candidatus Pacebacteria bacterium]|nr:prepilin-type N-terminal cleavage/methylation domain-containing protein [Candidatus Paceibacterota bacterium]